MKFDLKNGLECVIREAEPEDAAGLIKYINQVAGETDNLTFGKDEFPLQVEDEIVYLRNQQESKNGLVLIACLGEDIIGNLTLNGSGKKRLKHIGEFGISILQEYWGQGIGRKLMEMMLQFSRQAGLRKINLKVRDDNVRAIGLYQSLGFVREGLERRAMKIGDQFIDNLLMGLLLD